MKQAKARSKVRKRKRLSNELLCLLAKIVPMTCCPHLLATPYSVIIFIVRFNMNHHLLYLMPMAPNHKSHLLTNLMSFFYCKIGVNFYIDIDMSIRPIQLNPNFFGISYSFY